MNKNDRRYHIPERIAKAETKAPPPQGAFSKLPIETMQPGDLLLWGGQIWRIRAITTLPRNRREFTLAPVDGGKLTAGDNRLDAPAVGADQVCARTDVHRIRRPSGGLHRKHDSRAGRGSQHNSQNHRGGDSHDNASIQD